MLPSLPCQHNVPLFNLIISVPSMIVFEVFYVFYQLLQLSIYFCVFLLLGTDSLGTGAILWWPMSATPTTQQQRFYTGRVQRNAYTTLSLRFCSEIINSLANQSISISQDLFRKGIFIPYPFYHPMILMILIIGIYFVCQIIKFDE